MKKIIESLVDMTTFNVDEMSTSYDEGKNQLWCSVKTNEAKYFIGRNGETIMALNHIARRIIDKKSSVGASAPLDRKEMTSITIDVNNFQKKRIDNVNAMAHMMAERARYFKSNVECEPMSSYERRIVHEFLSDLPDIETESTGEGKDRRVVIKFSSGI